MKKRNKFKPLSFLPVLFSILIWTSCKVDRIAPVTEPVKDLTGTWRVIKATRNGTDLFPLVKKANIDFNGFTINFNNGAYTLTNPLPFIVSTNGTYSMDSPQYPFKIAFTETGVSEPVTTAFSYPVVNGTRILTLEFNAGCSQISYSYSLEKVN